MGEYWGDVGEYAGDVGEYAGDVGEYSANIQIRFRMVQHAVKLAAPLARVSLESLPSSKIQLKVNSSHCTYVYENEASREYLRGLVGE